MSDLIARLRRDGSDWCLAAADEIERLHWTIDCMKIRAVNLTAVLQSATLDARNIHVVRTRGHFDGLTADQQKAALAYRGPENHGDPNFKKEADV